MKLFSTCSITLALAVCIVATANSQNLSERWVLRIKNPEQIEVATLKIRFTDDDARSCMAGKWKRVAVEEITTTDRDFFPVTEPLSYMIDGSKLTIGRNEICDAYLHLRGNLTNEGAEGSYSGFGINSGRPLGAFTLTKEQ